MLNEFKEFAMKGNLVDMAVGFVMGSAFATVVTAFIQGIFMPAISPILGGLDLASFKYTISEAVLAADGTVTKEAAIIDIGQFLVALISFIIVALVMFFIIKGMNKAMPPEEVVEGPSDNDLLLQIRDLLAK